MEVITTTMTVADYCNAMGRGEIVVNRDYQRSDRVWPDAARSFLIETILLDYPMPKLSLHQRTDIRTRATVKEVVDGQQRSTAVRDFFTNDLRLSRTLELEDAAGRTYDELDGELQGRFLDYGLSFDLFVGAGDHEVREIFRRMNSFTVPLNPEEHRHAVYQGAFKWFIYRLSRQYDAAAHAIGLFSQKQLVRLQDTKLYSEICHALLYGISTTSKKKLDDLYRGRDREFPEEENLRERLEVGLDWLIEQEDLHGTSLMRPYQIYSLVLAYVHAVRPVPQLADELHSGRRVRRSTQIANLTRLAEGLDNPGEYPELGEFVNASTSRTNVGSQRAARARWFFAAITQESL